MKTMRCLLMMLVAFLASALASTASIYHYNGSSDSIQEVYINETYTHHWWVYSSEYWDDDTNYDYNSFSVTLQPGEYIWIDDSYEGNDYGWWGYEHWYDYSIASINEIPIDNGGGGGGGGGEDEPPLVDGGSEYFFDDNGGWVLIGGDAPSDSRWKQVNRGGVTLRMQSEDRVVSPGQQIALEHPMLMPAGAEAAYRFIGMGTLSTSDINIEAVPGQNNTYRGTTLDITFKNVFAFNSAHFGEDGNPSVGARWAEYQHYREYSSRLEELAEKIKLALEKERFGGIQSTKNSILLDIKVAYSVFLAESLLASQRFDSDNEDPNDPDVGSHRGDLQRFVRVPDQFYYYWDWNSQ